MLWHNIIKKLLRKKMHYTIAIWGDFKISVFEKSGSKAYQENP